MLDKTKAQFAFALENFQSYDEFIDYSIYYPRLFFKEGVRRSDRWSWSKTEGEVGPCRIEEDFGSNFKHLLRYKPFYNYYCIKDVNKSLSGHFNYDFYNFWQIKLYPCTNTSTT